MILTFLCTILFILSCAILLYWLEEFGIFKKSCCPNKKADCWCEQHTREKIMEDIRKRNDTNN